MTITAEAFRRVIDTRFGGVLRPGKHSRAVCLWVEAAQ